MIIDFVLMGHVSRETYHRSILDQLWGRKCSIDDGTLGVWGNAKRAWQLINSKSEYGIVIQDDAILCDNFVDEAEVFLIDHMGQIVSFYFGEDPKWIMPRWFDAPLFHAVCLAIPTHLIPDMIEYGDLKTQVEHDDMKMKRWLIANNKTCRYSNPSLVQHRDLPSIIDPTKPLRQSTIFKQ
jgi:hypothetical protein